jgi:hypothetical protein
LPAAVITEVCALLSRLATSGTAGIIDLRGLPFTDASLERLGMLLGEGEIRAEMAVSGRTLVQESAYAGVWRVRHLDVGGRVIADQIVINAVPDLIPAHPEDIRDAAQALQAVLAGNAGNSGIMSEPAYLEVNS